MDIRNYLFKYKMKQRAFARRLKISEASLNSYVHRVTSPTLERALHIYEETNGEVELEEMIAVHESGKPKHNFRKSRSHSRFDKKSLCKDKGDEV